MRPQSFISTHTHGNCYSTTQQWRWFHWNCICEEPIVFLSLMNSLISISESSDAMCAFDVLLSSMSSAWSIHATRSRCSTFEKKGFWFVLLKKPFPISLLSYNLAPRTPKSQTIFQSLSKIGRLFSTMCSSSRTVQKNVLMTSSFGVSICDSWSRTHSTSNGIISH